MGSWNLIGWGIIACLVLIFVVGPLIRFVARWMLWHAQKAEREGLPPKYSRWTGVWGGPTHYVNDLTASSAVISTDPNNRGGVYTSLKTWQAMVRNARLIRID